MKTENKKIYFHPASLELSHSYWHCLNAVDTLARQGKFPS